MGARSLARARRGALALGAAARAPSCAKVRHVVGELDETATFAMHRFQSGGHASATYGDESTTVPAALPLLTRLSSHPLHALPVSETYSFCEPVHAVPVHASPTVPVSPRQLVSRCHVPTLTSGA